MVKDKKRGREAKASPGSTPAKKSKSVAKTPSNKTLEDDTELVKILN
jgi:hypothetical protein